MSERPAFRDVGARKGVGACVWTPSCIESVRKHRGSDVRGLALTYEGGGLTDHDQLDGSSRLLYNQLRSVADHSRSMFQQTTDKGWNGVIEGTQRMNDGVYAGLTGTYRAWLGYMRRAGYSEEYGRESSDSRVGEPECRTTDLQGGDDPLTPTTRVD